MVPPVTAEVHRFTLTDPEAGQRLDRCLAERLDGQSRSRLKALILSGQVRLGGATITDPSIRVKPGDSVEVAIPPPVAAEPEPQAMPLDIVFEDSDILVLDKPPGLVVHPAAGNPDRTLVNALLAHCGDSLSGIGGVGRPGIVHRLDKDTSGLMVVAKNDLAHRGLTEQFSDRSLSRKYLALAHGRLREAEGEISGNIGRSSSDRKKMAVLPSGGKTAITRFRRLALLDGPTSLVECSLLTGRTHQVRVHLAHIGHPLVGDPVYRSRNAKRPGDGPAGRAIAEFPRQALHARALTLNHPRTGAEMAFTAPPPADFRDLLEALGGTKTPFLP